MLKRFRAALITPVLLLSSYAQSAISQSQPELDKKLSMYAKPAVVRVVTACFGDFSSWPGSQSEDKPAKQLIKSDYPNVLSVGDTITGFAIGTGYFINSNGYIATSGSSVQIAHKYADKNECKEALVKKFVDESLKGTQVKDSKAADGFRDLTETEKNQLKKELLTRKVAMSQFTKNSDDKKEYELMDEDLQYSKDVILPNGDRLPFHFPPGNGSQSSKYLAVIKIDVKQAPVLKLGNSDNVQVQDNVLVLGYPIIADQFDLEKIGKENNNQSSVKAFQILIGEKKLDLTISKRQISSPPKKLQNEGLILQIDGRSGYGGSGSPVLNEQGEVIGMVSYVTDFIYAKPASAIKEFVTIPNEEGETDRLYRGGLDLFWQKDYRRASAQFQHVKALFSQHSEVDQLITQSQAAMAEATDKSPSVPWLPIAVGGGVGVAALVGTAFFLGRRRTGLQSSPGILPVPAPPEATRRKRSQAMPENFRPNTAVKGQPFIKLTYQGQELVFDLQDDTYNLGRDAAWSDFKIPNEWKVISGHHAILQKEGEDFRIYDGDGQQPSTNGTYFRDSLIDASKGHLLSNGNQLKIGRNPNEQVLLTYFNPAKNQSNYNPTVVSQ